MRRPIRAVGVLAGVIALCAPAVSDRATPRIRVGQYLQLGRYNGEPILWRCVDMDAHGALMLSDRILTHKAFDAAGAHPNDRNQNRTRGGSNLWEASNIRAWLNSTAAAGRVAWPCGNSPRADRASSGASARRWRSHGQYNAYAQEKGFLADGNFTSGERGVIKTVTQKSLLNAVDSGLATSGRAAYGYHRDHSWSISVPMRDFDTAYAHDVTDTVFLLDLQQVYRVYQNLGNYYMGQPTANAVANSDYRSTDLSDAKRWHYWLRSPFPGGRYPQNVRYVTSAGYLFNSQASSSYLGVRPAFYLDLSDVTFASGNGSAGEPFSVRLVQTERDVGPD